MYPQTYNDLGECIVFTPYVSTMNAKGQLVRIFDNIKPIENTHKKDECNDCPICFETIEKNNCVRTECNHAFHASCLMRHTATNGYSCPYCRTDMVDKKVLNCDDDDDDDDDESLYRSDDEAEDDGEPYDTFDGSYEHYVDILTNDINMQNFRWLFQRANGEETEDDVGNTSATMSYLIGRERQQEIVHQENEEQMEKLMDLVKNVNISFKELVYAFVCGNVNEFHYNYHAENAYMKVSAILDRLAHEVIRNY